MGWLGDLLFGRSDPELKPDPRMQTLYGSDQLYTQGVDDLRGIEKHLHGSDSVVLGTNGLNSTHGAIWNPTTAQGHTTVIGSTRSGKFVGLIAPILMTWGGGVVTLDPKAESAWAAAERRRQMGQRAVIFDPWDEVNRLYGDLVGVKETVTAINPLAHIRPDHPDFGDEIAALADAVIVTHGSESQPHFPDSARDFVAGVMAAVIEHDPGFANFADVRMLVTASDDDLTNAIKRITLANPHGLAARKLARFVKPGSNELASIRSTAATQTAIFDDTVRILSAMGTTPDAFDMNELGTSQVSLFIVLPTGKLQSHGRLLRLILTLAIRAIDRRAQPPSPPVLFILDEMGTVGKLAVIENAYGLLAGKGIRVVSFLQNLGQLQDDYPKRWDTFFANSSNIIVLGVNDPNTADFISKYMGTTTITTLVDNISGGRSGGNGNSGWSQSYQYHARPLMLPNEVMKKDPRTLLILRDGGPYFHLWKSVYHTENRWKGLYRENPIYLPAHKLRPAPRPASPRPPPASPSAAPERPPAPPWPAAAPSAPPPPKATSAPLETVLMLCVKPPCNQGLRVPINRGRIWVTCPACRHRWEFSGS